MQEIAEIRNMIREKIEKSREKWNPIKRWVLYLVLYSLLATPLLLLIFTLCLVLQNGSVFVVGSLLTFFGVIALTTWTVRRERKTIFSLTEEKVVNEVKKLLTGESRMSSLYFQGMASEFNIKLFGIFGVRDIDKLKVLVNYDFSLSSYPNLFGSNLRWATYEELENAGLVCDENVKEKIAEKVKELGG